MKLLVVQKKLPYPPEALDRYAESFLADVRQIMIETGQRRLEQNLELADIGFVPKKGYVDLKLYFRETVGRDGRAD